MAVFGTDTLLHLEHSFNVSRPFRAFSRTIHLLMDCRPSLMYISPSGLWLYGFFNSCNWWNSWI